MALIGSIKDRTLTERSSLHQEEAPASKEKIVVTNPYSFPKQSPFSGDEIRSKNVASYEEWKYELDCLMEDGSYNESQMGQALRKSLRSQAKRVVMPLGAAASFRNNKEVRICVRKCCNKRKHHERVLYSNSTTERICDSLELPIRGNSAESNGERTCEI